VWRERASAENKRRTGVTPRRSDYKVSARRAPAMWRDGVHRRPRRPPYPGARNTPRRGLWLRTPRLPAPGNPFGPARASGCGLPAPGNPFGLARGWMWRPCDGESVVSRTACGGPSQPHRRALRANATCMGCMQRRSRTQVVKTRLFFRCRVARFFLFFIDVGIGESKTGW